MEADDTRSENIAINWDMPSEAIDNPVTAYAESEDTQHEMEPEQQQLITEQDVTMTTSE